MAEDGEMALVKATMAAILSASALAMGACATPHASEPDATAREDGSFQDIGYAAWNDAEPAYQLFPGDEIELVIPSAPENNKVLTVQPDGRVTLPLVGELMVAARPLPEVRAEASRLYARELRRPVVEMSVKAQPIKVFVGGEVANPAAYDMVGDGDALRAIIQAGGVKTSADLKRVVIIRRGGEGTAMMRTANLSQAFRHGRQPDLVPLARGDVVYVPRSGVANVGLFMQQYLRDALPFTFSYAINGTTN
jgi:protein involved in polysaccharide export with SLBB domain